MPLPSSGAISLSQVNVELGRSSTATISLGETAVRNLFGVASGAISLNQGYGKANQFAFSIASNQTNANLRTLAVNAGWNQSSKVVATINGGVVISSNSTGTPAMTVDGSFPNGVELVNNGYIIGMGGNGAQGGRAGMFFNSNNGTVGGAGGTALAVSVALQLRNNATIGGGGGGGGRGQGLVGTYYDKNIGTFQEFYGGGGGGGGNSSLAANSSGGSAQDEYMLGYDFNSYGGGAGTFSSAGGGGRGSRPAGLYSQPFAGDGASGGSWGANGGTGGAAGPSNGQITSYQFQGPGGSGGNAITGNGNITYLATGSRLGAIS